MEHLCKTCKHAYNTKGPGYEKTECRMLGEKITRAVWTCSAYGKRLDVDLSEMKQIALIVEKKKDAPGFKWERMGPRSVIYEHEEW